MHYGALTSYLRIRSWIFSSISSWFRTSAQLLCGRLFHFLYNSLIRKYSQKIYISYDSTNKNGQAGEIDFVEYSQLQYSLEKANGYGYKNVGSILDRGY